ncbi:molybdenum cofactor guanylyltransferase [Deinococcus antarcticus]|uniref:Probable molybdenum cofactor guanylyltransferase n=1 Tax=Deinococcus antarcticus TaxID=1298767 RepID=A0ABV8A5G1_9DEIO
MVGSEWEGVTGVITAGGKSRRFGSDKALARLDGVTLLERVAASLNDAQRKILIAPRGSYSLSGWEVVPDGRPGEGPLAGLETALTAAGSGWVAFAGVDMPRLDSTYWEALLQARTAEAWAVQAIHPQRGPQPLGALYHAALLPRITRLLDSGERRLRLVSAPEQTALVSGLPERYFLNVNTPDDLT